MRPDCKVSTRTITLEMPFKVFRSKNGGKLKIRKEGTLAAEEEDKSKIHRYMMKFLEDCNEQFGLTKLKHIFRVKDGFRRFKKQANSDDAEFEEILDISEIVTDELEHVYVSMVPFVKLNKAVERHKTQRAKEPASQEQSKFLEMSTEQSFD